MHSPYDNPETRLLCHVNDDLRSFSDPFGDDFTVYRRRKSNGRQGEGIRVSVLFLYIPFLADPVTYSVLVQIISGSCQMRLCWVSSDGFLKRH